MRKRWICLALTALLWASAAARAQMMGPNPFKKPNIADIFKPVVGNGAVYETQRIDQQGAPKQPLEMTSSARNRLKAGMRIGWSSRIRMQDQAPWDAPNADVQRRLPASPDDRATTGTARDGTTHVCRYARKDAQV